MEHQPRPGGGARDVRDGTTDTRDDYGGARVPNQREHERTAGVVADNESVGGERGREVPSPQGSWAGRDGHDDGSGDDLSARRHCEIPYRNSSMKARIF